MKYVFMTELKHNISIYSLWAAGSYLPLASTSLCGGHCFLAILNFFVPSCLRVFVWRAQFAQNVMEVRQSRWLLLRKRPTGKDHSERKETGGEESKVTAETQTGGEEGGEGRR